MGLHFGSRLILMKFYVTFVTTYPTPIPKAVGYVTRTHLEHRRTRFLVSSEGLDAQPIILRLQRVEGKPMPGI